MAPRNLITDVAGLKVGQADDARLASGVTAIVFDRPAVVAVDVRGGAPGTRETDLLDAHRTVESIDAVVLSGGSAFGLDAPSGVQAWLREQKRGFPIGDVTIPLVCGVCLFDMTNGWEGRPPTGEHVVVVSHRPKPDGWHPEASYHFVVDVASAVAKATELAGEHTVAVAAGDVGGQALALGLVDEVAMDVVPVVFGSGKRYFGPVDGQHLLEDPDVVIRGDRVLHLRYRVRR